MSGLTWQWWDSWVDKCGQGNPIPHKYPARQNRQKCRNFFSNGRNTLSPRKTKTCSWIFSAKLSFIPDHISSIVFVYKRWTQPAHTGAALRATPATMFCQNTDINLRIRLYTEDRLSLFDTDRVSVYMCVSVCLYICVSVCLYICVSVCQFASLIVCL